MRRIIPLSFVLTFLLASTHLRAGEVLTLAAGVWPPYTDEAGKPSVAYTLVKTALERSGDYTVRLQIQEPGDISKQVIAGPFSGSPAMWKTAEREESFLYSDPYLENQMVLVAKAGSDVSATDLKNLGKKRLGLVSGYAYGPAVHEAKNLTIVPVTTLKEGFESLLSGKADYILADSLLIQHLRQTRAADVAEHLAIGESTVLTRTLHLALRKDLPGAAKIIDGFNAEIAKMLLDGSYNRILGVQWILHDVDGDGNPEWVHSGAGVTEPNREEGYTVFSPIEGQKKPSAVKRNQLWIQGKSYQRWDDIPDQYKEPILVPESSSSGVLFDYDF